MAGGFQRPDHSSAEDEEPKLVIGVPRPHSNTPHTLSAAISRVTGGTSASWHLDFTLDSLSGIRNQPVLRLTAVLAAHPGVCPDFITTIRPPS